MNSSICTLKYYESVSTISIKYESAKVCRDYSSMSLRTSSSIERRGLDECIPKKNKLQHPWEYQERKFDGNSTFKAFKPELSEDIKGIIILHNGLDVLNIPFNLLPEVINLLCAVLYPQRLS